MKGLKPRFSIKNANMFLFRSSAKVKLTCSNSPNGITPESELSHNILSHLILLFSLFCGLYIEKLVAAHVGVYSSNPVIVLLCGLSVTMANTLLFAHAFAMAGMYSITYRPCEA